MVNQEYRPSKRAIWMAVNSDSGGRLVEIAQEHLKLVNQMPAPFRPGMVPVADPLHDVREILTARIEQLRAERDAIIQHFEGGTPL